MQPLIQKGRCALVVANWGDFRPPSHLGAPAPSLLLTGHGNERKWLFFGKCTPWGRQWDRVLSVPIWP